MAALAPMKTLPLWRDSQQSLLPQLETIYELIFIHDVYTIRLGKDTHAAVKRLQTFMRRLDGQLLGSSHPAANDRFLQLDIRNFFVSINRRILFTLIQTTVQKNTQAAPNKKPN
jgi:RNA-directed DNA polymerase